MFGLDVQMFVHLTATVQVLAIEIGLELAPWRQLCMA